MSRNQPPGRGAASGDRRLFDEGDTVDVLSLFGALRRRKWLIALVTAIGTGGALAYGLSVEPNYTARASVLIEPSVDPMVDLRPTAGGLTADEATVRTQIRLLQSRGFQSRVMEDLGLFEDPEFSPPPGGGGGPLSLLRKPLAAAAGWLPDGWPAAAGLAAASEPGPALGDPLARELARDAAMNRFGNSMLLFNDGTSYLIQLGFTSSSPLKAARVANRAAEIYVDEQLQSKLLATDRTSVWLQDRLVELREEVREAEEAVANFRTESYATAGDGATLADQGVAELSRALIEAQGQLDEKRARLAEVERLQAQGLGVEALSQVAASPVVTQLRQQEADLLRREAELSSLYGERHPQMQQLQREKTELQAKTVSEINTALAGLRSDVQVAANRVASLDRQLGGLREQSGRDRASGVRLAELERQAAAARQLYEEFQRSALENRERTEVVQPDVRIVAQAAVPSSPSTPGPEIFAFAGLLASLVSGSLLAIALERMDRGVRSSREVERLLDLNVVGMVPKLDKLKKCKPYQYLMDKPLSAFAESVRSIQAALKLSKVDDPPKVVLVTSSLPQEGKTTTAVCLATFAARSDKRVLLLDLDLRHPSVHRELGWQVSGGLVEHLADERSLEDVIHHDTETGLHFLPVKGQTTNPTDLLESQRLRSLVDRLRSSYDLVVIDSAPVASVTDTRLAARLADAVLFCVRWGETVASAAEDSVRALRDAGVEPVGAVLTQVDMKKHAGYGYADVGEYYSQSQKYYVN